MGPIDIQLGRLRERVSEVVVQEIAGTGWVLRLPTIPLPDGWSKPHTEVAFVVPQGYPFAKPDCFWADLDLRLANGNLPQNAQLNNPIPGLPDPLLWFSWHVEPWNPNRDDLLTWLTVIKRRFAHAL